MKPSPDALRSLSVIAVGCVLATTSAAQCTNAWTALAGGNPNGVVRGLMRAANGDLVVSGSFTSIGGIQAAGCARWNGTSWTALGANGATIKQTYELPNGDLVAAGSWPNSSGPLFFSAARWDGVTWQPLPYQSTHAAVRPGGRIVLAGPGAPGHVVEWNGVSWQPLGSGLLHWIPAFPMPIGLNPVVDAIAVGLDGSLYLGGDFRQAGSVIVNGIARWNGTTWSPLGSLWSQVRGLLVTANGDVVAAGLNAGGQWAVARWNGASWATLGSPATPLGPAFALAELPNGDIVAGGLFTTASGAPGDRLARWNGTTWLPVAGGANNEVGSLLMLDDQLLVGGWFTTVGGGTASPYLAALGTNCAASTTVVGTTCAGPTSLGALQANGRPWIGSMFRSQVAGVSAPLAIEVIGLAPVALPLPGFGCTLLAAPDALRLALPSAGLLQLQLAIPASPAFVGASLWQQVAPLSFDAFGQPELTTTNALQLTFGSF